MKIINYKLYTITLAMFVFLVMTGVNVALAMEKIGVVGAVNHNVSATHVEKGVRDLKVGDPIYLNDKIASAAKGEAQLIFNDRSTLTIKPNTTLVVDTYVYNPQTADGKMGVSTVKGAFRFIGGALSKKKPVSIKTPVSTIGIRGGITDTHVNAAGETDAVFLYGEEMTMTNLDGQTVTTTEHGTGFSLATPNGLPTAMPQSAVNQRLQSFKPVVTNNSGDADDGNAVEQKLDLNTENKEPQQESNNNQDRGGNAPDTGNSQQSANNGNPNNSNSGPISNGEGPALNVGLGTDNPEVTPGTAESLPTFAGAGALQQQNVVQTAVLPSGLQNVVNDVVSDPNRNQEESNEEGDLLPPPPSANNDDDLPPPVDNAGNLPPIQPDPNNQPDPDPNNNPPPPPPSSSSGGGAGRVLTGFYEQTNDAAPGVSHGDVDFVDGQVTFTESSITGAVTHDLESGVYTVPSLNLGANSSVNVNINGDTYSGVGYLTKHGALEYIDVFNATNQEDITMMYGESIFGRFGTDSIDLQNARLDSNAVSTAQGTHGVLMYNFLPEIHGYSPGSQDAGFFNYNMADAGLLAHFAASASDELRSNGLPGMYVDWQYGVFLAHDVEFLPEGDGSPSVTLGMGNISNAMADIGGKGMKFIGDRQDFLIDGANVFGMSGAMFGNEFYSKPNKEIEAFEIDTPTGTQALVLEETTPSVALQDKIGHGHNNAIPSAGNFTGFVSGIVRKDDGTTDLQVISGDTLGDVNINSTAAARDVGASINATLKHSSQGTPSATYNANFGSSSGGQSAYISDYIYAAEQGGTAVGSGTLYSGAIASGATANVGIKCNDCKYTNWGVWAAKETDAMGDDYIYNLIPYVAGRDVVQNLGTATSAIAAVPNNANAHYQGAAYGNFAVETGGTYKLYNAAGNFDSHIDLVNRKINDFHINFADIGNGNSVDIQETVASSPGLINGTGNATFGTYAPTDVRYNGTAVNGHATIVNGTLYGNDQAIDPANQFAKEVGGNFHSDVDINGTDRLLMGGVYHGAR